MSSPEPQYRNLPQARASGGSVRSAIITVEALCFSSDDFYSRNIIKNFRYIAIVDTLSRNREHFLGTQEPLGVFPSFSGSWLLFCTARTFAAPRNFVCLHCRRFFFLNQTHARYQELEIHRHCRQLFQNLGTFCQEPRKLFRNFIWVFRKLRCISIAKNI